MTQRIYVPLFGLVAIAIAAFAFTRPATADGVDEVVAEEKPVTKFMRQKLKFAQQVLEGMTTEDFDLIAKGSQGMQTMSRAADWQVLQTPGYQQHSRDFRSACDSVEKAAKKKNVDAAALAYIKVTLACVDCHKFVRSTEVTGLDIPRLTVGD